MGDSSHGNPHSWAAPGRYPGGMLLALLMACTSGTPEPDVAPADLAGLRQALAFPGRSVAPDPGWRPAQPLEGYTARAVAFDVRPGFRAGAVLYSPGEPSGRGAVIVAHGHFGGGKSSTESQEVAHRLAARGTPVLVVDTPGMEEWSGQGRELHFDAGAHNRALLQAAGTSAMGLQLAVLQGGLDLLEDLGHDHIVATGASGGAVQAFWLAVLDDRVRGVALASVPPIPREVRASGCACDQVLGVPGPDPAALAALPVPSLWLTEVEQDPPEGLPAGATWSVHAGPHSYTEAMQRQAVPWLEERLGHRGDGWLETVPLVGLRSAGPHEARTHRALAELLPDPGARWSPAPWEGVAYETDCRGTGPTVLLAGEGARDGALDLDRRALREAGFAVCSLVVPDDETGAAAAFGRGQVYADRFGGAVNAAARAKDAVGIYAVRSWGLAAAGASLPFVVRDPLRELDQVDPSLDPAWVHVPGAWWGSVESALNGAKITGEDPGSLAAALARGLDLGEPVDKGPIVP